MHPDKFFRANVGVVIINSVGDVLAFERADHAGAWQFPQGGIDKGESPQESIEREILEETGINPNLDLNYLDEYKDWILYELPIELRSKWIGRGQVQKWFLYEVKNDDLTIDLQSAKDLELSDWRWMKMEDLVEIVVSFRKPVYLILLNWLIERKASTNKA